MLPRRSFLASFLASCSSAVSLASQTGTAPKRNPDVPFVPTPQPVVEGMLKLGEVKPGDCSTIWVQATAEFQ